MDALEANTDTSCQLSNLEVNQTTAAGSIAPFDPETSTEAVPVPPVYAEVCVMPAEITLASHEYSSGALSSPESADEVDEESVNGDALKPAWPLSESINVVREISSHTLRMEKISSSTMEVCAVVKKRVDLLGEVVDWFSQHLNQEKFQELFEDSCDIGNKLDDDFKDLQIFGRDGIFLMETIKQMVCLGLELFLTVKDAFSDIECKWSGPQKSVEKFTLKPDHVVELEKLEVAVYGVEQLKHDMELWQRSVNLVFSVFCGIGAMEAKTKFNTFLKVVENGKIVFQNLAHVHVSQMTKSKEGKEAVDSLTRKCEDYEEQLGLTNTQLAKHDREIRILENNLIPKNNSRLLAASDVWISLRNQLNEANARMKKLEQTPNQLLQEDILECKDMTALLAKEVTSLDEYIHDLRAKLQQRKGKGTSEGSAVGELAITSRPIFNGKGKGKHRGKGGKRASTSSLEMMGESGTSEELEDEEEQVWKEHQEEQDEQQDTTATRHAQRAHKHKRSSVKTADTEASGGRRHTWSSEEAADTQLIRRRNSKLSPSRQVFKMDEEEDDSQSTTSVRGAHKLSARPDRQTGLGEQGMLLKRLQKEKGDVLRVAYSASVHEIMWLIKNEEKQFSAGHERLPQSKWDGEKTSVSTLTKEKRPTSEKYLASQSKSPNHLPPIREKRTFKEVHFMDDNLEEESESEHDMRKDPSLDDLTTVEPGKSNVHKRSRSASRHLRRLPESSNTMARDKGHAESRQTIIPHQPSVQPEPVRHPETSTPRPHIQDAETEYIPCQSDEITERKEEEGPYAPLLPCMYYQLEAESEDSTSVELDLIGRQRLGDFSSGQEMMQTYDRIVRRGLQQFKELRENMVTLLTTKGLHDHSTVLEDLTELDVEDSEELDHVVEDMEEDMESILEDFKDIVSNAFRRLRQKEDEVAVAAGITTKQTSPASPRPSLMEKQLFDETIGLHPGLEDLESAQSKLNTKNISYATLLQSYHILWAMYNRTRNELFYSRDRVKRKSAKSAESSKEEELVPTIGDAMPRTVHIGPPTTPDITMSTLPKDWKAELSVAKEAFSHGTINFEEYNSEVTDLLKLAVVLQQRSNLLGKTFTELRLKNGLTSKIADILQAVGRKKQALGTWQKTSELKEYSAMLYNLDQLERQVTLDHEHTKLTLTIIERHSEIRNKLQRLIAQSSMETIEEVSDTLDSNVECWSSDGVVEAKTAPAAGTAESKARERTETVRSEDRKTLEEIPRRLGWWQDPEAARSQDSPFLDQSDLARTSITLLSESTDLGKLNVLEETEDEENSDSTSSSSWDSAALLPQLYMPDLLPPSRSLLHREAVISISSPSPAVAPVLQRDKYHKHPNTKPRQAPLLPFLTAGGYGEEDATFRRMVTVQIENAGPVYMGIDSVRTMVPSIEAAEECLKIKSLEPSSLRPSTVIPLYNPRETSGQQMVAQQSWGGELSAYPEQPWTSSNMMDSPGSALTILKQPAPNISSVTPCSTKWRQNLAENIRMTRTSKKGVRTVLPFSGHPSSSKDRVTKAATQASVQLQHRPDVDDKLLARPQTVGTRRLQSAVQHVRQWVQQVGLQSPTPTCPSPTPYSPRKQRLRQTRNIKRILKKFKPDIVEDDGLEEAGNVLVSHRTTRLTSAVSPGWPTHLPGTLSAVESRLFCLDMDQTLRKAARALQLVNNNQLSKVLTKPGCQHVWNKFQLSRPPPRC